MGKKKLHVPAAPEKLHVPAPAPQQDDRSDIYLAFLLAVGLMGLSAYGFVSMEPYEPHSSGDAHADVDPEIANDPLQKELKAQRHRSEQIRELSDEQLEAMEWTDEDRRVVFRFGPRRATEVVCNKLKDQIEGGTLATEMRVELEKTLDRRTEFAPWTCMTRSYLAGNLPDGDLKKEMDEFWAELEAHEGNARIPISVLTDFRETRDRPENPGFYAWLRMCAYDFEYQTGTECRRLLRQISPDQGADMLLMLEKHWEESGIEAHQLPTIIGGLGYMARNGQPMNWKVAETDELPDYDVDFRQAAVGYLCRMTNTPTPAEREGIATDWDDIPALAAEQLRKVGLVGARAYEPKLLFRWRETCRIGFGGRGGYQEGEEYIPVPLLAVWDGEVANDPDFRLSTAIDLGNCELREGYPRWYCLSDRWREEGRTLDRAVAHFFIETRYMEWDDSFEAEPPPSPTEEGAESDGGKATPTKERRTERRTEEKESGSGKKGPGRGNPPEEPGED